MSEPIKMIEYKVLVFNNRTIWHNLEGNIHRETDPAIEWNDGTKFWYKNGQLHRPDGPAIERPNGDKEYWIEGFSMSKKEFDNRTKKDQNNCDGKVVDIDGVKYRLVRD